MMTPRAAAIAEQTPRDAAANGDVVQLLLQSVHESHASVRQQLDEARTSQDRQTELLDKLVLAHSKNELDENSRAQCGQPPNQCGLM